MKNVIQLLPDAIANQIAAGEVVQRPASVVKELLENAIDAGASRIDVLIKQAGKTLIQISDNGQGMSVQDARMAFERHATSKIRSQEDLFGIRTLGFRGEALASIAAVAQVRLRTRLHTEELGIELEVEASQLMRTQPSACRPGSTFQVKNLFFNVPARRNFLKSNPVETRHILNEFIRVALSKPDLHLSLIHNDTHVYDLPSTDLRQRVLDLFGQELEGKLIDVGEATAYASISGLMGDPAVARKQRGEQFFFVNGRYIRSNYLNHSITTAFQEFIAKDTYPFYCMFIDIDPVHVDINIHPTKTEVKFDDERTLYVLMQGLVKQGLGRLHAAPDFSSTTLPTSAPISHKSSAHVTASSTSHSPSLPNIPPKNPVPRQVDWDQLYAPPATEKRPTVNKPTLFEADQKTGGETQKEAFFIQLQERFLLTERDNCLLVIDQHLAHQRILFESFLSALKGQNLPCQQLLFPQTLEFPPGDFQAIRGVGGVLEKMGFDIKEFGQNAFVIYGVPAGVKSGNTQDIFEQILADIREIGETKVDQKLMERIARSIAMRSAVTSHEKMSILEMKNLYNDLFQCEAPGFAPNGKPTMKRLPVTELEDFFR
ncbi:MAG: DNA mismatch repair endonuclease MutL [Bacteroidota bacterium]